MLNVLGLLGLIASAIVAAVFVTAAMAKLSDRAGTRTAVREFGSPARLAGFLALVLPLSELAVAALLLWSPTRIVGSAAALGLLGVFSIAIAVRLAHGKAPDCRCFGQLHSAPVSWKTLVRNGILAVLAGTAWAAGLAGETPSAFSWIEHLSATGVLASALAVALVVLAAACVTAFLTLLRSYGKVLLRLDEIERRLTAAGLTVQEAHEDSPKVGHTPGTTAPAFMLADVNGAAVSLSDLLAPGRPLLLLFTSATCGPCKALLPDVAAWQRVHAGITIAILNDGDRDAVIAEARQHGLESMLADDDLTVYNAYHASGTPSAVLVAPDGTIASYVASGADSIKRLVDGAVPRSEPQGLSLGSSVLELSAPGLDGKPVSFARAGEETLVLFWNPGCGYCSSMRDDLLAWERHASARAPRLLIVSSGDEASTRAEGFSSTVALDPGFKAGAIFGAGGTPMAILVDSQGRIASPLAAGAEAVFALAGGRVRVDSGRGIPATVGAGS